MDHCGHKMTFRHPLTLRKHSFIYHCLEKECLRCQQAHADKYMALVLEMSRKNGNALYLLSFNEIDDKAHANLLRRTRDHDCYYYNFPAETKTYLFHTDPKAGGLKVSTEELLAQPWLTICYTAKNRRISSNVHIEVEPQQVLDLGDQVKEVKVKVESITTSAPKPQENELWRKARYLHRDLQPTTLEESVLALRQINHTFMELASREGYKVTYFLTSLRVVRKDVTWEAVEAPTGEPITNSKIVDLLFQEAWE